MKRGTEDVLVMTLFSYDDDFVSSKVQFMYT